MKNKWKIWPLSCTSPLKVLNGHWLTAVLDSTDPTSQPRQEVLLASTVPKCPEARQCAAHSHRASPFITTTSSMFYVCISHQSSHQSRVPTQHVFFQKQSYSKSGTNQKNKAFLAKAKARTPGTSSASPQILGNHCHRAWGLRKIRKSQNHHLELTMYKLLLTSTFRWMTRVWRHFPYLPLRTKGKHTQTHIQTPSYSHTIYSSVYPKNSGLVCSTWSSGSHWWGLPLGQEISQLRLFHGGQFSWKKFVNP